MRVFHVLPLIYITPTKPQLALSWSLDEESKKESSPSMQKQIEQTKMKPFFCCPASLDNF